MLTQFYIAIWSHKAGDFSEIVFDLTDKKKSRLRLWNMVVQSTLYKKKLFQSKDGEMENNR